MRASQMILRCGLGPAALCRPLINQVSCELPMTACRFPLHSAPSLPSPSHTPLNFPATQNGRGSSQRPTRHHCCLGGSLTSGRNGWWPPSQSGQKEAVFLEQCPRNRAPAQKVLLLLAHLIFCESGDVWCPLERKCFHVETLSPIVLSLHSCQAPMTTFIQTFPCGCPSCLPELPFPEVTSPLPSDTAPFVCPP